MQFNKYTYIHTYPDRPPSVSKEPVKQFWDVTLPPEKGRHICILYLVYIALAVEIHGGAKKYIIILIPLSVYSYYSIIILLFLTHPAQICPIRSHTPTGLHLSQHQLLWNRVDLTILGCHLATRERQKHIWWRARASFESDGKDSSALKTSGKF